MRTKLVAVMALVPSSAFAHSGHDHGHWLSDPIHVATVMAIAAIALVGGYFLVKNKLTKISGKED